MKTHNYHPNRLTDSQSRLLRKSSKGALAWDRERTTVHREREKGEGRDASQYTQPLTRMGSHSGARYYPRNGSVIRTGTTQAFLRPRYVLGAISLQAAIALSASFLQTK